MCKAPTNERRRCICDIFFPWQRHCAGHHNYISVAFRNISIYVLRPIILLKCLQIKDSLGQRAIWDIRPKLILNPNFAKTRSSITSVSILQSSWNFAQNTAVSLPCSVQNCKTIGQLRQMLWTNEISRDLSSRWVWDRYPILLSVTMQDTRPKRILNSNLVKSLSLVKATSVVDSFWNFAQNTVIQFKE